MTRAPRFGHWTFAEGVSAPRHAAFKLLPRGRGKAATKYLITFAHRFTSQRRGPAPSPGVLDTRVSPEAERELVALDIVCAEHAPAEVRAALSEISELDAVRDDVILVATELVTNAVLHSGATAGDTLHVQAVLRTGSVLLSVDDPGRSGDAPRMRDADGRRSGGHGLRIVNQLARRWGVDPSGEHRVWAELATDHRELAGSQNDLVRGPGRAGPLSADGALQTFSAN